MHRKSLEAAEHLKEDSTNSDHEETTSMRTEASDTSASSTQPPTITTTTGVTPQPANHVTQSDTDIAALSYASAPPPPPQAEDAEAFRNNSIACLRAKAQEHSAKLLNHNLLLHARANAMNAQHCDSNANTLHHQEIGNPETNQEVF